jgi:transcriptional regulator with XRE-family HTH domain
MQQPPSTQAFGPAINRIGDAMAHIDRFAFRGTTRLAEAAGVSPSTITRIVHGEINPSFLLVARITRAMEDELGHRIDPRDLVSENGEFLTRFACDLADCRGCLPDSAIDEFGDVKSAFVGIEPGAWISSRHPRGFEPSKGGK